MKRSLRWGHAAECTLRRPLAIRRRPGSAAIAGGSACRTLGSAMRAVLATAIAAYGVAES